MITLRDVSRIRISTDCPPDPAPSSHSGCRVALLSAATALVQVEGSLQTRSWEDKDGAKRYTTEVVARQVQVLTKLQEAPAGSPPEGEEPPSQEEDENIPF